MASGEMTDTETQRNDPKLDTAPQRTCESQFVFVPSLKENQEEHGVWIRRTQSVFTGELTEGPSHVVELTHLVKR